MSLETKRPAGDADPLLSVKFEMDHRVSGIKRALNEAKATFGDSHRGLLARSILAFDLLDITIGALGSPAIANTLSNYKRGDYTAYGKHDIYIKSLRDIVDLVSEEISEINKPSNQR
jgi:hypothetical protein